MPLNVDVSEGAGLTYMRTEPAAANLPMEHLFTFVARETDGQDEAGAVASIDRDPSFTITTFRDHQPLRMPIGVGRSRKSW